MQGLGYKQLWGYLDNEYDLATAVQLIKRDTRRYAKRQLTWFRRDPRIHWFNPDNYDDYSRLILEISLKAGRTIENHVK